MRCKICDKEVKILKRGMCAKHYRAQIKKEKEEGTFSGGRKYQIVFDYKNWSKEKAWFLGVVLGDGHVLSSKRMTKNKKNRRTARVSVTCGDRDVVTKVIEIVSPGKKIHFEAGTHRVDFFSKELAEYCSNILGIDGKKEEAVEYPKAIPSELEYHFIRGLIDSDGHIGNNEGIFFLGMKAPNVIQGVARFFIDRGFKENADFKIRLTGVKTEIRFLDRETSIKALNHLYEDNEPHIRCERKYREFTSSTYKLFNRDTSFTKHQEDNKCLVCGDPKVLSRGLCQKHYMKQSRDWDQYLAISPVILKAMIDQKQWRNLDWGIKNIVKSYFKASFNLMMPPASYIETFGVEGINTSNVRSKISQVRKNFRVGTVSWFATRLGYEYLKQYVRKGDIVFDPFMGWGARMVASYMLGCKYIGFDLNTRLVNELKQLSDILYNNHENIHYRNSGILDNYNGLDEFDFFITSPPYWIKEIYCEDIGQPQHFSDYVDFMDNLIFRSLEQTVKRSRKGGLVFVKNLNVESVLYNMADDIEGHMLGKGYHVERINSVQSAHPIRKSIQTDCILFIHK